MTTLLDMFEQAEQKFSKLGARDIHKLKYMFDATASSDYGKMSFELRTVFSLIEGFQPREMKVMIDDTFKRLEKLEFNPTISGPNITFRDSIRRDFSVWYKPIFYAPHVNSSKELQLDFAILRGNHGSMYELDAPLKKELYTYEFFSDTQLREIAIRMLGKLKPLSLVMQCKERFMPSDVNEIKAISYFLKPSRLLVVSEDYLPEAFKMGLPVNASYVENVDMNDKKLTELGRQLL